VFKRLHHEPTRRVSLNMHSDLAPDRAGKKKGRMGSKGGETGNVKEKRGDSAARISLLHMVGGARIYWSNMIRAGIKRRVLDG